MADQYLIAHSGPDSMDFYLRPEDGVLFVDEPDRDMPFMVEPEATHALLMYLEERREVIERAQKQLIQTKIDLKDMGPPYSEADVSPRFELADVEEEDQVESEEQPLDWREIERQSKIDLEAIQTDQDAYAFIEKYLSHEMDMQYRYRELYRSDRHEMGRSPQQAVKNLLSLPPL